MVQQKMLDCSKVDSNESRSQSHTGRGLKMAVGRRHPSNLGQLEQFAKEDCSKLPVERCRNLIETYRKHLTKLTAVTFSKGCATKY